MKKRLFGNFSAGSSDVGNQWNHDVTFRAIYTGLATLSTAGLSGDAIKKYELGKSCQTPHLTGDEIKQKFLTAFNTLMGGRDELIANCRLAQSAICDCKDIDSELDELHKEIKVVTELSRKAINDNARVTQSQDEFNEWNNGYLERYRKAMDRVSEFENKKRARKTKNLILDAFIREIESRPPGIDEFDDRLWAVAVDRVTVTANGGLIFRFKDGSEAII